METDFEAHPLSTFQFCELIKTLFIQGRVREISASHNLKSSDLYRPSSQLFSLTGDPAVL